MRIQVMISQAYPSNDKPRVLKNYGSWDTHQTPDGLLTGYKCHRNYLKPQVKKNLSDGASDMVFER